MVGGAIKVSPILKSLNSDTYSSYFPKGNWVSLIDHSEVIAGGDVVELTNKTTVNAHLRPGSLIPF